MVQRASELPRKGITDEQRRFAALAKKVGVCHDDYIICRACNAMFQNPMPTQYPQSCLKCRVKFSAEVKPMMPDLVIDKNGMKGIVFVQQKYGKKAPHSKAKGVAKDEDQIAYCRSLGYKVYVVWNESINNSPNMNLIYMILGMYKTLDDDVLYRLSVKDENDELLVRV